MLRSCILLLTTLSMTTAFVPPGAYASRLSTNLFDADVMEPVRTPKTEIPHNFGPISQRDQVLYTAERPGNPSTKGEPVGKEKVEDWIAFMKGKGIKHVLALLDENELEIYAEGGGLMELYEAGGMVPHLTPMRPDGAYTEIMDILNDVEKENEKAVCHCTGGIGRAGRVAAAWLSTRHSLSPEEATKEVIDQAIESGVQRLGHVEKLSGWMGSK